jgi:hypothetical protein
MVLTNLSLAAGVSALGNIRKKIKKSGRKEQNRDISHSTQKENEEEKTPLSVRILSGAGVWALLTGIISLFFASFFAVKLSLIDHNGIGIALGLAIWALFSFTMIYLESKGISALVNTVFTTAWGTVKTTISGAGSIVKGAGSLLKKNCRKDN